MQIEKLWFKSIGKFFNERGGEEIKLKLISFSSKTDCEQRLGTKLRFDEVNSEREVEQDPLVASHTTNPAPRPARWIFHEIYKQ